MVAVHVHYQIEGLLLQIEYHLNQNLMALIVLI
jgi:hypothetical protein